jgi:N4-gp56 family major capsid protein
MGDVQMTSADVASAVTFKIDKNVLKNLRNDLVFANDAWTEQGEFDPGHDTVMFLSFEDLSPSTTPMTEGTRSDKRALTMGTVTLDTDQYGGLLSVTDVAKYKSPVDLIPIGSEKLTRESRVLIDQVHRDVIALGGTPYFANSRTSRGDLIAGDIPAVEELTSLKWLMFEGNIPIPADGYYRLLASPEVSATLALDPDFQEAVKYRDNMPLLKNEIGTIAGFRVMSVQNAPTVGTSPIVHLSIAFGDIKGWASGELSSFQSFYIPPGGDHGDPQSQEALLSWKIMFGVAVLDNARYYRYESVPAALS